MTKLCDDRDLAILEPALFSDCSFPAQVLADGTGASLTAGSLSFDGLDFAARGVEPGCVAFVYDPSRMNEQLLEVTAAEPGLPITLSALRPNRNGPPITPDDRPEVCFRICTFAMQAGITVSEITQRLDIQPGCSTAPFSLDHVLNREDLRRPCMFGTLARIFASLSTGRMNEPFFEKRCLYTAEYQRACERMLIELDTNGDGRADAIRLAGIGHMIRE